MISVSKIVGIVFSVPANSVDRLFIDHRNVFVKYTARTTNLRLTPKHRLILYASHGSKEVVGESVIEAIEFLTPREVFEKYANKVFLSKDELKEYSMHQPERPPSRKMLTLTLSNSDGTIGQSNMEDL